MDKKLLKTIEIARCLKPTKQTGDHFHLSAAFDKSRMVAVAWNNYRHGHLTHRFGEYRPTKVPTINYRPCRHSESELLRKMKGGIADMMIVNVRIDNNGTVAMSKPCPNCQKLLDLHRYRRICYSISEREYGVIDSK